MLNCEKYSAAHLQSHSRNEGRACKHQDPATFLPFTLWKQTSDRCLIINAIITIRVFKLRIKSWQQAFFAYPDQISPFTRKDYFSGTSE